MKTQNIILKLQFIITFELSLWSFILQNTVKNFYTDSGFL